MEFYSLQIEGREWPLLDFPGRPQALLDQTIAEIYEVTPLMVDKAFEENRDQFPLDFYFELTEPEVQALKEVEIMAATNEGEALPLAFTHMGCNMLASILRSPAAIRRSVQIIQAFQTLGKQLSRSDTTRKGRWEDSILRKWRETLRDELEQLIPRPPGENYYYGRKNGSRIGHLEEKLSLYEREIQQLRDEIRELKKAKDSHLVIPALTSEVYRNREEIQKLRCDLDEMKHEIEQLELPFFEEEEPPQRITSQQVEKLKELAGKQTDSRKEIMGLWADFKKYFGISRYMHLTEDKYSAALEWLKARAEKKKKTGKKV